MKLLSLWLGMAVLIAAMLISIQWVTASFIVTGNGPIKWAEGWDMVESHWLEVFR